MFGMFRDKEGVSGSQRIGDFLDLQYCFSPYKQDPFVFMLVVM